MGTLIVAGNDLTPALLNQYYGNADVASTTVTAASQQNLSTVYSIPANEPAVNSAYELTCGGTGQWGSTQQLIAFTLVIGGVVVLANCPGIAATTFAASANFRWTARAQIVWSATGASGAVFADLFVSMNQVVNAAGAIPTAAVSNFVSISDANAAASSAIDTTSAVSCVIKCGWAGTTGAPTITNRHTIFKKVS